MAKINYEFFDDMEGLKYRNDMEEKILSIVRKHPAKELYQYLDTSEDYLAFYNLSVYRENLLNWYPFKTNSSCLEVGAGLGALTGCLCEKVSRVVSLEMTRSRSEIIYERYKNYDNLEIIVGNLDKVNIEERFDYIVVVGVLEYAKRFIDSDNAHVTFMKILKKLLKPSGVILLAIENRLGMCYFSGEPESHTNKLFLGLNNYDGYDYIRTFSKSELTDIVEDAGFKDYKMFYPFPSYSFPTDIYTDEALKYVQFGRKYINLATERLLLFDEFGMYKALQKENLVTNFSNSFLMEIFNESRQDNNILYVNSSVDKNDEYRVLTIFENDENDVLIKKYPLMNEKNYLQNINRMLNKKEKYNTIKSEFSVYEKNCLIRKLNLNISLEEKLNSILEKSLKSNLSTEPYLLEIKNVFRNLMNSFEANSVVSCDYINDVSEKYFDSGIFNGSLKCVSYVSLNPKFSDFRVYGNRIKSSEHELIVDFLVPVNFLMYQLINTWYEQNILGYKNAEKIIKKDALYNDLKLSDKEIEMYSCWRNNIIKKIYSSNGLRKFKSDVYSPILGDEGDISSIEVRKIE